MKPPIEKPIAINPPNLVTAAKIPSWKTPPEMIPHSPPRTLVRNPPSLDALASLAAMMATRTEAPVATARRAMELLAACERELHEMEKLVSEADAKAKHIVAVVEAEQAFLSNFKTGENLWFDSFGPHEKAKLEDFLKACTPKPMGKLLKDKFQIFVATQLFRKGDILGIPTRTESEAASIAPLVVKRFSDEGLPVNTNLSGIRDAFLDFLKEDSKKQKSLKVQKSKKLKPIHGAARNLHDRKSLTPNEKTLLMNLTPEENQSVVDKLGLLPAELRKWKAALEDLKTPAERRPKVRQIGKNKKTF